MPGCAPGPLGALGQVGGGRADRDHPRRLSVMGDPPRRQSSAVRHVPVGPITLRLVASAGASALSVWTATGFLLFLVGAGVSAISARTFNGAQWLLDKLNVMSHTPLQRRRWHVLLQTQARHIEQLRPIWRKATWVCLGLAAACGVAWLALL